MITHPSVVTVWFTFCLLLLIGSQSHRMVGIGHPRSVAYDFPPLCGHQHTPDSVACEKEGYRGIMGRAHAVHLEDETEARFVPGSPLDDSDLLLSVDNKDNSLLMIQLSQVAMEATNPLHLPVLLNSTFFVISLECGVQNSSGWNYVASLNASYIKEAAPSAKLLVLRVNGNESLLGYSQCVPKELEQKLDELSRVAPQSFFLLRQPTQLHGSDNRNKSISYNLLEQWLSSWGTSYQPTVQIYSYPGHLQVVAEWMTVFDASGTTGWDISTALLQEDQSGRCARLNESIGVCGEVRYVGNACFSDSVIESNFVASQSAYVAVAQRGNCTFVEKAYVAQQSGYAALVIVNSDGNARTTMVDDPDLSAYKIFIPVVMVDEDAGYLLQTLDRSEETGSLMIRLFQRDAPAPMTVLDAEGTMREIGYVRWTDAIEDSIVAQASYDDYRRQKYNHFRLAHKAQCEVISVMENQKIYGGALFYLPNHLQLAPLESLKVHVKAECIDGWDRSCPAWDKMISFTLCAANETHKILMHESRCLPDPAPVELLRTITSYGRYWAGIVDATPLLYFVTKLRSSYGYNSSQMPSFLLQGWGDYLFTIDFVLCTPEEFIHQQSDPTTPSWSVPADATLLWTGTSAYDEFYNIRTETMNISLPAYTKQVQFAGYFTGHGWGIEIENCAEFCPHSHSFIFRGMSLPTASQQTSVRQYTNYTQFNISKVFSSAGSDFGCAMDVSTEGVSPNQHGTWLYGRGGWCPGQVVPLRTWPPYPVIYELSQDTSEESGEKGNREWGFHLMDSKNMKGSNEDDSNFTAVMFLKSGNLSLSYISLLHGHVYYPKPRNWDVGGFAAEIRRNMWLVLYYGPPPQLSCILMNISVDGDSKFVPRINITGQGTYDASVEIHCSVNADDLVSTAPLMYVHFKAVAGLWHRETPSLFITAESVEQILPASSFIDEGGHEYIHFNLPARGGSFDSGDNWSINFTITVTPLGPAGAGKQIHLISTVNNFSDDGDNEQINGGGLNLSSEAIVLSIVTSILVVIGCIFMFVVSCMYCRKYYGPQMRGYSRSINEGSTHADA